MSSSNCGLIYSCSRTKWPSGAIFPNNPRQHKGVASTVHLPVDCVETVVIVVIMGGTIGTIARGARGVLVVPDIKKVHGGSHEGHGDENCS